MARRLAWTKHGRNEYRDSSGRFVVCATRLPRLGVHWHLYDRGAYLFHGTLKEARDHAEQRAKVD